MAVKHSSLVCKLDTEWWSTIVPCEDAVWEHKLITCATQPAPLTVEPRSAKMAPVQTALRTAIEVSNPCTF